ncbi:hypothetical protein N1851_033120 [Merluccius polli]|uniref:Uncharacterized protein n=1 Tax=Merluccius polli TaxID=89951 RepID=A0AA47M1U4_MERPO|nr:hypothetical protein N1851_033120 [Merluccius polli]
MLQSPVNHDSPTTSMALRNSGWNSSTPGALPPRSFLTTSATSAPEIGEPTPESPGPAALPEGVSVGLRSLRSIPSTNPQRPESSNRHSCAPLGLPVPACCLRSPTGQKGPIGLLQFDGICRHGRHRPPCGHSSVSKTCGRKSDNTTIKSIIELRPRVSWCQAQTTVRIRPPTQRRREATLSSTGVNSNIQAPSQGAVSIATPARRLSPVATPEWKRVQPLSRRLVPEPLLCVEVRPTISSRNFSTLRTSSGSFPTREVTFHIPRASFCSRGSDRQGPCLRPLPSSHCTRPLWPLPLVVSLREGGPTSSLRSVPVPMGPGQQALTPEPHPQAWLQGGAPKICQANHSVRGGVGSRATMTTELRRFRVRGKQWLLLLANGCPLGFGHNSSRLELSILTSVGRWPHRGIMWLTESWKAVRDPPRIQPFTPDWQQGHPQSPSPSLTTGASIVASEIHVILPPTTASSSITADSCLIHMTRGLSTYHHNQHSPPPRVLKEEEQWVEEEEEKCRSDEW